MNGYALLVDNLHNIDYNITGSFILLNSTNNFGGEDDMPVSERVCVMKNEFMRLHSLGFDIPQIADKFGLARKTVYQNLQNIATENGVCREELLKVPHRPHKRRMAEDEANEKSKLEIEELLNDCTSLKESTEKTLRELTNIIDREEKDYGTSSYTNQ